MKLFVFLFVTILSSCQSGSKAIHQLNNEKLNVILDSYFKIQRDLAFDDNTRIITYTHTMRSQIDQLDQSQIVDWPASADEIKSALEFYTDSLTINESRQHFQRLTRGVIKLIQNYGYSTDVFVMKCPMAFNNTGATWLQTDKDLINPYFGAEMFKCGNVLSQLYHAEEN